MRILERIGCQYMEPGAPMYQRIELDLSNIVPAIHEHAMELECMTGKRPRYLLLGQDQYIADPARLITHFMGLDVVLIPWMDGMIVLPELPQ